MTNNPDHGHPGGIAGDEIVRQNMTTVAVSASEKLRALDARKPEHEWPNGDDVVLIFTALPLIADVVEAAEAMNVGMGWGTARLHERLDSSLTALREHLEGQ